MKGKVVILLSGGLDSTTLLNHLKHNLKCESICALTVNYGQKHFARELPCACWQARRAGVYEHRIIDISFFREMIGTSSSLTSRRQAVPDYKAINKKQLDQPPTYVPHRNLILISLACAYAESHGSQLVYYAAQKQDYYGYWDCTPKFVARMNFILALDRKKPIALKDPFVKLNKSKVLKIGLKLNVDFSRTWSCYRGHVRACGKCPACVERLTAFKANNICDPLKYESGQ